MQNTIQNTASISGKGLHLGSEVTLTFKEAGPGSGITFHRVDLGESAKINLNDFEYSNLMRRTGIKKGRAEVHTIEHLMAALWALSIDNLDIEINGQELPGLDGSAKEYFNTLKNAGVKKLEAPSRTYIVKEPIWCDQDNAFIGIFPNEGFRVSYILESPSKIIGKQYLTLGPDKNEIIEGCINARTFCLKEEAEMLLKMGFGKGANTKNTLVLDKNGPIDNDFRYKDEPVRHKILDLIGDLYLAGQKLEGRVVAIRSGHELNARLVKKIRSAIKSAGA